MSDSVFYFGLPLAGLMIFSVFGQVTELFGILEIFGHFLAPTGAQVVKLFCQSVVFFPCEILLVHMRDRLFLGKNYKLSVNKSKGKTLCAGDQQVVPMEARDLVTHRIPIGFLRDPASLVAVAMRHGNFAPAFKSQ